MVTEELVDKALQLVAKSGGNYEHFFANLNSPDWIPFLQKRGRFSHPPPAIIEGNYVRFPRWPEGEYLIRMAPIAPDAVFAAIDAQSYESNNYYVHEVLLRIGAELPVNLAAHVALAEAEWSSKQHRFSYLYDDKIVPLILKLAGDGRSDAALEILNPLLQVEAAPNRSEEKIILSDGRALHQSGTPVGRIDAWNLQRLLLRVTKPLVDADGEDFLALISSQLNAAVGTHVNDPESDDDFSYIWRPRIDSGRFGDDLMDILISGTRDAAVQIVQGGGHDTVLRVFANYQWPIFRRLEFYVLSQADDLPTALIDGLAIQEKFYENQGVNPEFSEFLSRFAGKLSEGAREKLLSRVDAGPDLSRYSNYLSAQGDKRAETERWITEDWRLKWLLALKSIIGEERSKQLDELLAKYGSPRPAVSSGGAFAVGHVSEISLENLKKFSIQELIEYLKAWVPPPRNQPETPSRAGIGRELQEWVSQDPALFSANLGSFQLVDLHPTYLRSILDGLTAALKGERKFDPYNVAKTIEWLLINTKKTGPEHFEWDEDPGWSWAHMSSARFLTELFLHPDRLDTDRHQEFWPSLRLIAENPSPTYDDEAEYRKTAHFGMLALNSTRPVGLEAVMRYVRWLKLSAKDLKADAQGLPDVFGLLASHTDGKLDNSVAVREMYGMQFALLAWLDPGWWEQQLKTLFPTDGKLRHLDRFAWNSYLRFSHVIPAMLPAMWFRYERAVRALQSNMAEVTDELRSLGSHFMQYYAAGAMEIDDPLLALFFEMASPGLRAQTIGDVGWQLGQEGAAELAPEIQQRFMKLLEYRLAHGANDVNASREELSGFGWWFASKKFPDDWAIDRLLSILEKFREINPDFAVVKRLGELAAAYPYETVRAMGIIFEEDREGWAIHGWEDAPQIIINEALKAGGGSRAEAERIVNLLVARGHFGFRSLLKKAP